MAEPSAPKSFTTQWGFALILVLYTYGGWNEIGYVGAEVRRPEKNMLRTLILGTVAVMVLYVLAGGAFVRALGFSEVQQSPAVAADMMDRFFGPAGRRIINLLICVSALGSINGQLFTGARIAYAFGRDHRPFHWLGRWNSKRGIPPRGLIAISAMTLALIAAVGRTEHGFESVINFTTPVCWTFFGLVVIGLIVLRFRKNRFERKSHSDGHRPGTIDRWSALVGEESPPTPFHVPLNP
jgi:amino acid transporter